jgi:hypothetical protein
MLCKIIETVYAILRKNAFGGFSHSIMLREIICGKINISRMYKNGGHWEQLRRSTPRA